MQCLAYFGVIDLFELNRDYIVKNLCENRDKPELRCCGKCYLQKQLKKVDDNTDNSKNGPVKVEKQEVLLFLLPTAMQYPTQTLLTINSPFNPGRQHMHNCAWLQPVFRPPFRFVYL
jgi:hypothetical protein